MFGGKLLVKTRKIYAFINGMIEFRSSFTKNYDDYGLSLSYDYGREWAHKLTFRKYDD